jgi:dolichyl-phosphate beta-glucosyltransferase
LARRVLSRGFRQVVVRLVRLRTPLSDTQCGFKLFRGNAGRELFAASFSDGFVFDLEILLRAEHRGFRIREFPVEWTNDPDSRFPSVRGPIVCLFELLAVMFRLAREFRAAEKTGAR